ncbi:SURP and G-patch domain-containing 1 [Labeo rohita]|uniref:SURP and G-patch domain-containing 1 n=1 Tax=Labeo rohita TaxID=84645 RepID=A0A498MPU5_LABRO|nr:SURP and G-patch domain-containing 1 [Labeo rohita]
MEIMTRVLLTPERSSSHRLVSLVCLIASAVFILDESVFIVVCDCKCVFECRYQLEISGIAAKPKNSMLRRSSDSRSFQNLDETRLESLEHNGSILRRSMTIEEEGLDRSDRSDRNSFKNHNRTFHKLFPEIPETEDLGHVHTCGLQKEVIYHGKMYLSNQHICFHSSVLLKETKVMIDVSSIQIIKKKHTAKIVPNAIAVITTDGRKTGNSSRKSSTENTPDMEIDTISSQSSLEENPENHLIHLTDKTRTLQAEEQSSSTPHSDTSRKINTPEQHNTAVSWVTVVTEKVSSVLSSNDTRSLNKLLLFYVILIYCETRMCRGRPAGGDTSAAVEFSIRSSNCRRSSCFTTFGAMESNDAGRGGWKTHQKSKMNVIMRQEELIAQKKREIEARLKEQAQLRQKPIQNQNQSLDLDQNKTSSFLQQFLKMQREKSSADEGSAGSAPSAQSPPSGGSQAQKRSILIGKRPGLGVSSMINQFKNYSQSKKTALPATRPSVFSSPDDEEDEDIDAHYLEVKEDGDLRLVVDKMAAFVAEGGAELEKKAMEDYKDNPVFSFLFERSSKEYLYYRRRVAEIRRDTSAQNDVDDSTRKVAEKLARFVADGGPEVEIMAAQHNRDNPAFSFLYDYQSAAHRFYKAKVDEYRQAKTSSESQTAAQPVSQEHTHTPAAAKRKRKSRWGAEDDKMQEMYDMIMKHKRAMQDMQLLWEKAIKNHQHEYDSDEEVDPEDGTWEHRLRQMEMEKTREWAEQLTEMGKGKHFIGDFLPPDELEKFMETFKALKEGRDPDYSEYKEFKLTVENIGFQMLMKMGWKEGEGSTAVDGAGFGVDRPAELTKSDDEYDAFRKRMMLAYRFRPNPLNNPRRPYY